MTYKELQEELKELPKIFTSDSQPEYEESFEFAHFKVFFALKNDPGYAILQAKDSEEFATSEDMWFLTYAMDAQRVVLDVADEETICDEFYQLMVIWMQGNRIVQHQPQ